MQTVVELQSSAGPHAAWQANVGDETAGFRVAITAKFIGEQVSRKYIWCQKGGRASPGCGAGSGRARVACRAMARAGSIVQDVVCDLPVNCNMVSG